ncbi:MAG: DUF4003 family protein [Anaerobacillus sp.]|uniref:DUF4003 family protein n=1 Tax=Anaerobacillus sp. TaxID=1872506 RepID=UPI00391D0887
MGFNLDEVVNEYAEIYGQLKKELKWKVSDERSLMLVASLYMMSKKSFDLEPFVDVSDYIKRNVGFFSTLKSSQRFTTAAMLDIRYDHPKEKFEDFIDVYEKCVNGGFRRGPFTYIAALCLLRDNSINKNVEALIQRGMEVYKAMKNEHFFLTGESDYPLALLLAQVDQDIDEMMKNISYFYHELNGNGFRRGNDLQFLSHILSLQKVEDPYLLIARATRLLDDFKQAGRRIKTIYYPVIGILSLLENCSNEVPNVMNLFQRLNSEKLFKWHKDMNFMIAVNLIVKDKVEHSSLLSASIQTTIEAVIQAQQAAMIAAMAGTAVATSSSNT